METTLTYSSVHDVVFYLRTVVGLWLEVGQTDELTQEVAFLLAACHTVAKLCRPVCHQQDSVHCEARHVQSKPPVWLPRGKPAHNMAGVVNDRTFVAKVASKTDRPHGHSLCVPHLGATTTQTFIRSFINTIINSLYIPITITAAGVITD